MHSQVKTHANKSQSFLITTSGVLKCEEVVNYLQKVGIKIEKNSPDHIFIKAEKKSISIDAIRNLKKHIFQKPVKSTFRLAIIEEADKLTTQAQNSFLKLLEEPPSTAKLILVTSKPKQLLPTVRSRLTTINLQKDPITIEDVLEPADLAEKLETVLKNDDFKIYIEAEILSNYKKLINSLSDKKTRSKIEKQIHLALLTKKMIDSNVNPKFAILNYLLS